VRGKSHRILVRVAEDHRRRVAATGRQGELLLKDGVGDAEQDEVDRLRQIGVRRVAAPLTPGTGG